jgi:macrodomain Ter protein organizer (MatP/YcbG family)
MTTKKTWTEEEYEAAGKKSIHLRLNYAIHDLLTSLANKLGVGRADLVEQLIVDKDHEENRKSK